MVGSWRGWVAAAVVAVLAGLALLGRGDPSDATVPTGEPREAGVVVVDGAAPAVIGVGGSGDAAGRGATRVGRPVALPVGDDEAVLAVGVTAALIVGGWVLVRGDGWGARPVVASPLAARRGPPR